MKNIPATKPSFSNDDIKFITKKFEEILSGKSFLSMGKYSQQFEEEFATYTGTNFAVACNSGTSALELIFRALDVKDKEVILPSNTFIATANAIINAGGTPVFSDCNDDMCLDYEHTIKLITENTAAICHVHIGGLISNSAIKLAKLCDEKDIHFVEDAAQAHGTIYDDKKAGTLGIAAGFSFFSTKVITTGEGGMVTTNDAGLVEKMKSIREFGKEKKGIFTNYHTSLGYNWRMPEVSALMGIRQLKSIEAFIEARKNVAMTYDSLLNDKNGIRVIRPPAKSRFNYFKYIFVLDKLDRQMVHEYLIERGINPSGYVYELPLHKQPVFSEYSNVSLPNTELLCSKHICLPIYPSLKLEETKYIVKTLTEIL